MKSLEPFKRVEALRKAQGERLKTHEVESIKNYQSVLPKVVNPETAHVICTNTRGLGGIFWRT